MINRSKYATKIQTKYRSKIISRKVRKIIEYEKNYHSIKWYGDALYVCIVSNFTNPPFQNVIKLDYDPFRKIFVKYLNGVKQGVYYIKFIIDGKILVCNQYPTAQVESNTYNVITIEGDKPCYSLHKVKSKDNLTKELKSDEEVKSNRLLSFVTPKRSSASIEREPSSSTRKNLTGMLGNVKEEHAIPLDKSANSTVATTITVDLQKEENGKAEIDFGMGRDPYYESYYEESKQ